MPRKKSSTERSRTVRKYPLYHHESDFFNSMVTLMLLAPSSIMIQYETVHNICKFLQIEGWFGCKCFRLNWSNDLEWYDHEKLQMIAASEIHIQLFRSELRVIPAMHLKLPIVRHTVNVYSLQMNRAHRLSQWFVLTCILYTFSLWATQVQFSVLCSSEPLSLVNTSHIMLFITPISTCKFVHISSARMRYPPVSNGNSTKKIKPRQSSKI